MIKQLLLIPLLLSPALLLAEPDPTSAPWYEIEIILFEHSAKKERFKEVLNQQTVTPDLVNTIELIPPATASTTDNFVAEVAYQRLDKSQLQLSGIVKQLKRRSAYTPLLHLGWRQPGLKRDLAPAVLIYPYPDQAGEWREKSHIFGYIRLFLSRYLHIDSDLVLSKPVEIPSHRLLLDDISTLIHTANEDDYFNSPDQLLITQKVPLRQEVRISENHYFRIDESRRLRKQELHYFDHPRFGMLIVVRDYIPPLEPTTELPNNISWIKPAAPPALTEAAPAASPAQVSALFRPW
ncbi:hypothetical protein MNBD_GAMMA03-123 [hydrothermal vent metagenome]|uniref:Uncharacterized protein n=1 Tax=hydrothermal vent metagenome TaxID=652676 RepID=A0A3B0WZW4_9ZZZZ